MRTTRFFGPVVLAVATLLGGSGVAAADSAGSPCILHGQQVVSVKALRSQERVGRGTIQRLAGAEVFVRAKPGLTAEWLELNLKQHLAGMQGSATMKDCALDVEKVSVRVRSAGTGFAVQLKAPNRGQAEEVLRRAQLLVH